MVTGVEALKEAVKKAGGQSALARMLGKRQSHVWDWLNNQKAVPAEFVLPIERATGISRHQLRPDLYPQNDGAEPSGFVDATAAGDQPDTPILRGVEVGRA